MRGFFIKSQVILWAVEAVLDKGFFIKSQVILWAVEAAPDERFFYKITSDFMGGGGGAETEGLLSNHN